VALALPTYAAARTPFAAAFAFAFLTDAAAPTSPAGAAARTPFAAAFAFAFLTYAAARTPFAAAFAFAFLTYAAAPTPFAAAFAFAFLTDTAAPAPLADTPLTLASLADTPLTLASFARATAPAPFADTPFALTPLADAVAFAFLFRGTFWRSVHHAEVCDSHVRHRRGLDTHLVRPGQDVAVHVAKQWHRQGDRKDLLADVYVRNEDVARPWFAGQQLDSVVNHMRSDRNSGRETACQIVSVNLDVKCDTRLVVVFQEPQAWPFPAPRDVFEQSAFRLGEQMPVLAHDVVRRVLERERALERGCAREEQEKKREDTHACPLPRMSSVMWNIRQTVRFYPQDRRVRA
jgi:hypothetical protein